MAFLSMFIVWLGANIWFGALILRHMITSKKNTTNRFIMLQEYVTAQHATLSQLRRLIGVGCSAIITGTLGIAITQKDVTPLQATSSSIAALTMLGLVFHVEHNLAAHIPQMTQKLFSQLYFITSGVIVIISSVPLILPTLKAANMVFHWAIVLTCGVLIGAIIASITLISLLAELPSPHREQVVADIGTRWTVLMGGIAAVLAIASIEAAQQVWSDNHLFAIITAIGLAMPFVAIIGLRIAINLRLESALAALPILGMPERSLGARTRHIQEAAYTVLRLGIASALVTIMVAGATLAFIIVPANTPQAHKAILPVPATTKAAPTITPAAQANQLIQKDNGITVTLSGGPFRIGKNRVHPGTWHIVALVATADQSASASIIFAVSVASKE